MSYILDALKKADAERERGSVPGLHSQPLGQVEDDDDGDGGGALKAMPPLAWLGAGVGLCLIAVLSWQLLASKKDEAATVASAPAGEQAPMQPMQHTGEAPVGQQGVGAQQDTRPAVPRPPAQTMQPTVPSNAPAPRMPPPQTGRPFNEEARPMRESREPREPRQAQQRPSTPGNNGGNATAGERIPTANELPDDVRHTLPQLTIGGAMYSDTPANRMLIVNSQVFHEGDQPYQGLVLEEIKLKSAVFRYKGYRYAISY
jgi:general secretion pathway protein B